MLYELSAEHRWFNGKAYNLSTIFVRNSSSDSPVQGEELFVFNEAGKRCTLLVAGLMAWVHVNRRHPLPPIVIKDAFIGSFSPPQKLIGGPVINGANEVVGIAVAAFEGHREVIIKPWSTLEHCIEMQDEFLGTNNWEVIALELACPSPSAVSQ